MKNYSLRDLIKNVEKFKSEKCPADLPIKTWLAGDNTIIRWNPDVRSYQLIMGTDLPVWMFGFGEQDIVSPYLLIGVFNRLFPGLDFEYDQKTMQSLINDRIQSANDIIGENVETLSEMDANYRHFPNVIIIPDAFMMRGFVAGGF